MACEGGECKVQLFDVRVKKIKVVSCRMRTGTFEQRSPPSDICLQIGDVSEQQIADALRKPPKWLSECPGKKAPAECACIFLDEDLDPAKGWTRWVTQQAPKDEIEIPGTDGPQKPQTGRCLYRLDGTFQESSKILHGACLDTPKDGLPKEMTEALKQRNAKNPKD
jgi:hypothetical protein